MVKISYNSSNMDSVITSLRTKKASFNESVSTVTTAIQTIENGNNWSGTDYELAKLDFDAILANMTKIGNNIASIEAALTTVQTNMAANKYGGNGNG
jgi:prefoldin subunit 5